MNKAALISAVSQETGLTPQQARAAVESQVRIVQRQTALGEKVTIPGFGSWEAKDSAARTMRNPATGEPIEVPASRRVKFTAGASFKDQVNGNAPIQA